MKTCKTLHLLYTDSSGWKHSIGRFATEREWEYWIFCVGAVADKLAGWLAKDMRAYGSVTHEYTLMFDEFISMLGDLTNKRFKYIKQELKNIKPGLICRRLSVERCKNDC